MFIEVHSLFSYCIVCCEILKRWQPIMCGTRHTFSILLCCQVDPKIVFNSTWVLLLFWPFVDFECYFCC